MHQQIQKGRADLERTPSPHPCEILVGGVGIRVKLG